MHTYIRSKIIIDLKKLKSRIDSVKQLVNIPYTTSEVHISSKW